MLKSILSPLCLKRTTHTLGETVITDVVLPLPEHGDGRGGRLQVLADVDLLCRRGNHRRRHLLLHRRLTLLLHSFWKCGGNEIVGDLNLLR